MSKTSEDKGYSCSGHKLLKQERKEFLGADWVKVDGKGRGLPPAWYAVGWGRAVPCRISVTSLESGSVMLPQVPVYYQAI